jgi:hypothetical protein
LRMHARVGSLVERSDAFDALGEVEVNVDHSQVSGVRCQESGVRSMTTRPRSLP